MIINAPSPQVKLKLLAEFRDCIDAAASRKFVQIWVSFVDLSQAFQSTSGGKTHNHLRLFQASRVRSPRLFHRHQMGRFVLTLVALEVRRCTGFRQVTASIQVTRGFHRLHELNRQISRNVGPLLAHPSRLHNGDFHRNCSFRMDPIVLYRNSRPIHRIYRGRRQLRRR